MGLQRSSDLCVLFHFKNQSSYKEKWANSKETKKDKYRHERALNAGQNPVDICFLKACEWWEGRKNKTKQKQRPILDLKLTLKRL